MEVAGRMKRLGYRFLTAGWALMIAYGCGRTAKTPEAISGTDALDSQTLNVSADTTALHARVVALDSELALLKTHFKVDTRNLPVPSYYHENWNYAYYIHDNGMMAGVDEAGEFFLIDSYNCSTIRRRNGVPNDRYVGLEICNYKTSWLELRWPDTTIVVRDSGDLEGRLWPQTKQPIKHDSRISTGYFCTDFHPLHDDEALVKRLADPAVGDFRFYRYCEDQGKGDIGIAGKRDRPAIRDCARLSILIRERKQLLQQLDLLTSLGQ